ncbi:serine/threonine-protein kinase PLK1-like [Schistocerca gregaria]|nr:serine/threonine-protein kinase PLK1-like [Schistocerca cancellata]XP_049845256.1 serine/threonine-protein kinase PLK1-like [Schistocerca gregaria]
MSSDRRSNRLQELQERACRRAAASLGQCTDTARDVTGGAPQRLWWARQQLQETSVQVQAASAPVTAERPACASSRLSCYSFVTTTPPKARTMSLAIEKHDNAFKGLNSALLLACEAEPEAYNNNDSLDSGIAGIKDPHSYSGRNNDAEAPVAEYIVDPTTRTTYLKGKFLGKGGFARVHELMDLTTDTVYAGKIIPKNRITKRHHIHKIAREIFIHRGLVHKHVVRLHHFFEDALNAYIILENCPRKSLVHVLKHRWTITEPEVRYYLSQLVSGVQYIHSQNVIHRDLKPGNMFLSESMVVKLGDFGLAMQIDGDKRVSICGTPNYIAPEVLNKLSYSFEADVWAIGCIMFAMLVGQPPFETATLKDTYARIVSNKYTLPPCVSETACSLIRVLLQPLPEDRPKLEDICKHEFFTSGYTPETLSPSCCYTVPNFPNVVTDRSTVQLQPRIANPKHVEDQHTKDRLKNQTHRVAQQFKPRAPNPTLQEEPQLKARVNGLLPKEDKGLNFSQRSEPKPPMKKKSMLKLQSAPKSPDLSEKKEKSVTRESGSSVGCMPTPSRKELRAASSLKQMISSVLCPDKLSLCRKRVCNAVTLYRFLTECFNSMPTDGGKANPHPVNCRPLFVSKWIDYSNKYGFGFQLSDKSVGVLFNDSTRISFNADRSRVEFHDANGKITAHPIHSVPAALQERLTVLRYFSHYMDEHLTEGGDGMRTTSRRRLPVPHMRRWVRTNAVIIMELCNGTIQINFFKNHTKLILSDWKQGLLVTYINSERQSVSYWLHEIELVGCDSDILDRLKIAAAILREFAELDGEVV